MKPISSSMLVDWAISTLLLAAVSVNLATACTDTVYVGTGDGYVAKSKDGGNTWSTLLRNGGTIYSIKVDGDHVYAGTKYGIAISHDGGASWKFKTFQYSWYCDSSVVGIFLDEEKRVYASTGCTFSPLVAISSDNGETWPINFTLPYSTVAYNENIYVNRSRIYVATASGLGYTDDIGVRWGKVCGGTSYCVVGSGQAVYAGFAWTGAPLVASIDGGRTWKFVHIPLRMGIFNYIYSMYLLDGNLYAATWGGGLTWSNDLATWTTKTTVDGLLSDYTTTIIGSINNLYLGTIYGLSISHDKGRTWTTCTTRDGLPSNNIITVFAQCV